MTIPPNELVALITATSFAAGLNVYATLATLGILGRLHALQLPPNLHLIESWWVISLAVALFLVEMFADKVPYFDLLWNALHTFIRVPIAALLAYGASAQLSPQWHVVSVAVASVVALAAHTGKTAIRAGVTPSPEPISNIALSTTEDLFAVFLTWFATRHPYIAAALALIMVIVLVLLIRLLWRGVRRIYRRIMQGPEALPGQLT